MPGKEVDIIIKPDGSMEMDLMNFKGSECAKTAEELMQKIGCKDVTSKRKAEYFQENKCKVKQQVRES